MVSLGEDVRSVRSKIGMADTEYHSAWKRLNTKAQEICQRRYGTRSAKVTNTLEAIAELKDHFALNRDQYGSLTSRKMAEAVQVRGSAAWLVHNALKRNNDKHKNSLKRAAQQSPAAQSNVSRSGNTVETGPSATGDSNAVHDKMWDPIRNIFTTRI
ncbi:hypothetical protein ABVK25_010792 [Lepraria finkii]|uniref:Uncharacterized protein n=1 Tax=Lepraria finkii TaxID=1340010 RepID=A0ABR4ATR1_9LECA